MNLISILSLLNRFRKAATPAFIITVLDFAEAEAKKTPNDVDNMIVDFLRAIFSK